MNIVKCEKIKNTGVFPDFKWPQDLEAFKAFNLFYGWNGSGKTTLSRLLRYLEDNKFLPEDWEPEFKIHTESGNVENSNPDFLSGSICVFNVDFIEENIKWSDGRTKKLLIGKANQELAGKLTTDRQSLKNKTEKNLEENKNLEKARKDRDNFLSKRASEIKKRLTTSIQDKYQNYNRTKLLEALSFLEDQDDSIHKLDQEKEKNLNAEIQQNAMPEVRAISLPDSLNETLLNEAKEILLKSPASSFIETLKKDTDLNAWVKRGYDIHKERNEQSCQFCLQPLPAARMGDLEKHFSDEYKNFIAEIDRIGVAVKGCRDKYAWINLAHSADFYQEYQEEYKNPQQDFYDLKSKWQDQIDGILAELRKKRENPFDTVETDFAQKTTKLESEILSSLSMVNSVIEKHNEKAKNIGSHIARAKQAIEYGMVVKLLEEHHGHEKSISTMEKQIEERGLKITALEKEIGETEAKVLQPKIGEGQINKDLHRFLGREDIKLQYIEDGYSIIRNGKKAKNLSESEKTAIALIYFFSKIREGKPVEEKIIVIDDPISSLDSQSTHFALSYIKDNIADAKQVFLLTHNFYCLKEVKNWKRRKGFKKDNFATYMLECRTSSDGAAQRRAVLSKLDPLLDKYDSEYHFLFSRLYSWHIEKPQNTLEDMYPLANMARKVLDTFLSFKAPQTKNAEEQIKQLGGIEEDEINCLIRFLDVSSHSDAPERIIEFPPSSIEEMGKIIDSLIHFIQKADEKHFNGMKSVIDGQAMSAQAKAA